MWVAGTTPLQTLFTAKPHLKDRIKRMVCICVSGAPTPWDSGAVMYYLDPEDYGEPEVTEICIGTSWTYLGGLFRP